MDGDIFLIFDVVHAPPFFVPWQSCVVVLLGCAWFYFFDRFLSFPDRQEWETGEYFDSFFVTRLYVIDGCCLFYFRLVIPTFTGAGLGSYDVGGA